MQITLKVKRDMITPDVQNKLRRVRRMDTVLKAMGQAVVSLTRRAFFSPSLRPAPWPVRKKQSSHPILLQSKLLQRSIRVTQATNNLVKIGSDRPYASVHQFGSKKKKGRGSGIPPRPYFPLEGKPRSARLTRRAQDAVVAAGRRQADALLS